MRVTTEGTTPRSADAAQRATATTATRAPTAGDQRSMEHTRARPVTCARRRVVSAAAARRTAAPTSRRTAWRTRGSASCEDSAIGAAAEAGRVVVVARVVRGGRVQTAVAVDHRVDVVAAAEGARRIARPLVQVAHHVVRAALADAARERA